MLHDMKNTVMRLLEERRALGWDLHRSASELARRAVEQGLVSPDRVDVMLGGLSIQAARAVRSHAASSGWSTDDSATFRLWRQAANALLVARDLGIVDDAYLEPLFAPGELPARRGA